MNLPHTSDSPSSVTLAPRLPGDILYLIGYFSSFEVLTNLVRCNKWLHNTCSQLLFREIHLRSLTQVINLFNNKEAMGMLSQTKHLILSDDVFGGPWKPSPSTAMSQDAAFIQVLRVLVAMKSLVQLHIYGSSTDPDSFEAALKDPSRMRSRQRFSEFLSSSRSSPTLLPNLTIINESLTGIISLGALCPYRPVIYRRHLGYHRIHLDICPGLSPHITVGTRAMEVTHSLSAHDIGSIIRESKLASAPFPSAFTLSLAMRFPDEIRQRKPCPIKDQWQWIRTVLVAAELDANELRSINIRFEPLPRQHLPAHLPAIEQLHRSFPSLQTVIISSDQIPTTFSRQIATITPPKIRWSRNSTSSSHDGLTPWVVHPNLDIPETIGWWCDMLTLANLGAQNNQGIEQTAKELNDRMRLGWGENVPSVEELISYLRRRNQ